MQRFKILFLALLFLGLATVAAQQTNKTKPAQKVELVNKKIRPRDNTKTVECNYYSDGIMTISFPQSEGWAEIAIETPTEGVIFKDRFHSAFEYSAYVGIPTEPWIITIITTQGGEYAGTLPPLI